MYIHILMYIRMMERYNVVHLKEKELPGEIIGLMLSVN